MRCDVGDQCVVYGLRPAAPRAKSMGARGLDHRADRMLPDAQPRPPRGGGSNAAAEAIIARQDGLTVAARVLRAPTSADTRWPVGADRQLSHKLVGRHHAGGAAIARRAVPGRGGGRAVRGAIASRNATEVILFVTDPERAPQPEMRFLMELFGLTATEARVALALAAGDGVPETARARIDFAH
jgi:hypothetical protein